MGIPGDRDIDDKVARTRSRPLPSGQVTLRGGEGDDTLAAHDGGSGDPSVVDMLYGGECDDELTLGAGDITQVDLPGGTSSGLRIVSEILRGVDDVYFSELDATDVVRHRLVGDIVSAYSAWDEAQRAGQARTARPVGSR